MLNTLIIVTIEQLTIIFIEQCVFFIPFENSDNLERSLVQESPSLRCFLNDAEWINTTYQRARREAMVETSLSEDNFAIACPFSVNEILDLDFYPNAGE